MPALSRTGPGATLLTPGTVVVLALVLVLTPFLATTGAGPPPVPFGNDRLAPQADRTDAAGTPGGAVGSIQITLQNSLAVPTGPYQQKIVLDSSSFSDLINSNWSNGIAFYTSNDTPVYGWLESNATNASSQTVLYLRLGSIPAGGSTEVSIFFWAKNSFNLSASGYMGEAPELSPVYGEFDNGAQVFNLYDDFARTTLGPSWLVHGSWPATLSDGFTVSAVPGQGDTIVSSARFPYPAVVDFYGDLYQSNPASAYYSEGMGSGGCPSCGNASTVGWSSQGSGNGPRPSTASGSSGTGGSSVYPTQTYAVFTTEAISSTQATFLANYTDAQNLTRAIPSGPLPVSLAGTGAPPGGLTNPSTTQWIRERSYVAQMPTAQYSEVRLYPVTFTESGLPTGTGWWVNVTGGPSVYSQTTTLPFSEPTGSFAYVVATLDKTYASPSGTFEVSTAPASVPLTFSLVTYPITFTESGLPTGMGWWANVTGGPTSFSTTGTVSVSEPNGTYTYSLAAATRIYEAPGGPVTVDGAPVSIAVDFSPVTYGVTFTETGLPAGTEWWVNVSGGPSTPSAGTTLRFSAVNGSYDYAVASADRTYDAASGSLTVRGASVAVTVPFSRVAYTVTFAQTGLPTGTSWSVRFDGVANSGTGDISFSPISNGTYEFTVGPVPTYSPTPSSGTVTVNGSTVVKAIDFQSSASPTFLGLPQTEGYGVLGAMVLAIAVVVLALVGWTRKDGGRRVASGPPTPPATGRPPASP